MTSNVGQNYPYTSETERRPRRRASRRSSPRATGLAGHARGRDHAARRRTTAGGSGSARRRAARASSTPRATRSRSTRSSSSATGPAARRSCAERAPPPRRRSRPSPPPARRRHAARHRDVSARRASASSTGCRRAEAGFSPDRGDGDEPRSCSPGPPSSRRSATSRAGSPWPGIVLLTVLLNARHLLYSASLAPWLRDVPSAAPRADGPPPDR